MLQHLQDWQLNIFFTFTSICNWKNLGIIVTNKNIYFLYFEPLVEAQSGSINYKGVQIKTVSKYLHQNTFMVAFKMEILANIFAFFSFSFFDQ